MLGAQQRHLTADQLGVLAGALNAAQVLHLLVDLAQRIPAVGRDPLRLLGVVARRACEVAARKHAVRAFTSGRVAAEKLRPRADVAWPQPAPLERALGFRVHETRARHKPFESRSRRLHQQVS